MFSICLSYFLGSQAFFGPRHPRPDHQPQADRVGLTLAASAAQRRGGLGCGQPQDVVGAEDGGGERDVLARHRQARRPLVARDATGNAAVFLTSCTKYLLPNAPKVLSQVTSVENEFSFY